MSFVDFFDLSLKGAFQKASSFSGSAYALHVARRFLVRPDDFYLVFDSEDEARKLVLDLREILPPFQVLFYPAYDRLEAELLPPNALTVYERLNCLKNLSESKQKMILVTTKEAVEQCTIKPSVFKQYSLKLESTTEWSPEALIHKLHDFGYRREEMVASRGEFSRRGDILDIFPSTAEKPVRIEFFGDIIESIRVFDLYTQRSVESLGHINVYLVQEVEPGAEIAGLNLPAEVLEFFARQGDSCLDSPVRPGFAGLEWLNPLFRDASTVRDYRENWCIPHNQDFGFVIQPMFFFAKNMELLTKTIQEKVQDGYQVLLSLPKKGFLQRVQGLIREKVRTKKIESVFDLQDPKPGAFLLPQTLQAGFEISESKLLLITYQDFTGSNYQENRTNSAKLFEGDVLHHFSELKPDDYVIHQDHGIARFTGIETIVMEGIRKEYLILQFDGTDRLYIPITEVDRITRFTPVRDGAPVLNKLSSIRWAQVKSKVKEEVEKYAKELLDLYAKRTVAAGFRFAKDTAPMEDLESGFEYDETNDQRRAIAEIKQDMESNTPMDRLLCGDVGYGKTEVAIRAAYKAVLDGKQVAVLCPTTILAQQHFQTFSSRLLGTKARICVLNRFVSAKDTKAALQGIRSHEIDIVIGTHRLLSSDIKFSDLGLMVIDEEQRFGVGHKEKLKQMRIGVDTLVLSATPIPRTLNMALSGARGISVIHTPPAGRLPVKTFVLPWQEQTIHQAISRELKRKGQVFYVYNRIETIASKANQLIKIVPGLRLRYLHGQMDSAEIEDVMGSFMRREFDCLLATTIIESGMDIPNVNTIMIDQADAFGLAQLYQLRGRIGRRDVQGFAYLMYQEKNALSEVARKRLGALEEFTDLGSGFKIAMRDLEIRGAGNLLGKAQSGHIHTIGFDLYSRLLRDAIEKLKDSDYQAEMDMPQMELRMNAFLSEKYIPAYRERMDFFRRISYLRTLAGLEDLKRELFDRYGAFNAEMNQLFQIVQLRVQSHKFNAKRFQHLAGRIQIEFHSAIHPWLKGKATRYFGRGVELPARFSEKMSIDTTGLGTVAILDKLNQFFSEELEQEFKEYLAQAE